MSTWFKYYRSSTDHHLRSKPLIWIYWLYCLEQAAWKDHTVFWKGEEYTLQTGHFITTIEQKWSITIANQKRQNRACKV